ncbi:MAG: penicillin-binding protein [Pyrinomonadaceae bacterium]
MLERHSARSTVRPDALRRRASVVAIFLSLWMVVVGARLVYLQTSQHETLRARARAQQQNTVEISPARGVIFDRSGRELARSVNTDSFFVVPGEIADIDYAAVKLAAIVGGEASTLAARLKKAKEARRKFAWVARKLDAEGGAAIRALNLKGIYALSESKRRYPNGSLASHILGFVGLDEKGLAGVEQFQNILLTGKAGEAFVEDDARGESYESVEDAPRDGRSVVLTIDQTVQYRTEKVLAAAVENARARSGTAVVLDPRTGEILALANAPTFDPNEANKIAAEARTNQALQNIYEPGSTFKIVAYAAAIEERLARPDDRIDCQMGSINVAGRTVRDHSPFGTLTLTEALAKSSNVAAIKLGLRVGDERMYDYIKRFGFGTRTGIELPGETVGLLRPVKRWQPTSMGSIAIGQEIGVTPVQIAAAFGALANDGVHIRPHLVREMRDAEGLPLKQVEPEQRRVVSAETARTVRRMLESVTLKGTAKAAQLDGYTAAGKTGTAQKIDPQTKAYSRTKHVASFVGFAPVENPSVVIAVVIDEPAGAYHGGQVAAPVFRELAEVILPYLNVMRDSELKTDGANGQLVARKDRPAAPRKSTHAVKENEEESVAPETHLPEVAPRRDAGEGVSEVVYAVAGDRTLLMPDLRGRSVRDAARVCAQLGLELEARGEGRALSQFPAGGENIRAGQIVRIDFGRSD